MNVSKWYVRQCWTWFRWMCSCSFLAPDGNFYFVVYFCFLFVQVQERNLCFHIIYKLEVNVQKCFNWHCCIPIKDHNSVYLYNYKFIAKRHFLQMFHILKLTKHSFSFSTKIRHWRNMHLKRDHPYLKLSSVLADHKFKVLYHGHNTNSNTVLTWSLVVPIQMSCFWDNWSSKAVQDISVNLFKIVTP